MKISTNIMSNLLLIGVYNIILSFYPDNVPFPEKRNKLIKDVTSCPSYKNYKIIIVFDSKEQSFSY